MFIRQVYGPARFLILDYWKWINMILKRPLQLRHSNYQWRHLFCFMIINFPFQTDMFWLVTIEMPGYSEQWIHLAELLSWRKFPVQWVNWLKLVHIYLAFSAYTFTYIPHLFFPEYIKSTNKRKRIPKINQKRKIQRNWQHSVHKMKKNKTKLTTIRKQRQIT